METTDQQGHGLQQPVMPNEGPSLAIPSWLAAFMQNQQETNARLEQGITQLHQSISNSSTTPEASTQNPTPVPVDTHSNPFRKPKHSLTPPDQFTGEDELMFPQFRGLLEAKLEIDGHAIGSERERVWYAFGRLAGQAAGRIYPWMEASKSTDKFTVDEFLKQLDAAFADPQKQAKALSKINRIRQGNREFRDFLREFEQTLLEAQGWKWDDQVRKGYLKAAINRELRDRLVTQEEPTLYSEYVAQLRRISDNLQEVKAWDARRGHMTRMNNNTTPQARPSTDVMEWEPTRISTAATGRGLHNRPQQGKHATSATQAERQTRRENGACVRCGSMDHWVSDCPLLPAIRSTQRRDMQTAKLRAPRPQISASTTPRKKTTASTATKPRVEEVEEWETDEESGKE